MSVIIDRFSALSVNKHFFESCPLSAIAANSEARRRTRANALACAQLAQKAAPRTRGSPVVRGGGAAACSRVKHRAYLQVHVILVTARTCVKQWPARAFPLLRAVNVQDGTGWLQGGPIGP